MQLISEDTAQIQSNDVEAARATLHQLVGPEILAFNDLEPGQVSIIDVTNEKTGERRVIVALGGIAASDPVNGGNALAELSSSGQIPGPLEIKSMSVFAAPFGSVVALAA